jgi:arylsulfatase
MGGKKVIGALAIVLCAAGCSEPEPRRTRNVLLVTLDTLRADHLGCYGYQRPTSPRIDAFAAGATLYRRSFSASPWTVPTHASLFTGKAPLEHGARTFETHRVGHDNVNPLHEAQFTLAEMFAELGVDTGAFVTNSSFLTPRWQLDQGFATYTVKRHYAPETTQSALAWLEENADNGFFLFLNYIDVHKPYNTLTPAPFLETPAVVDDGELLLELYDAVMPGNRPVPAELAQQVIDQYDTAIANLDQGIGALFDGMRELGLFDDTLIVLTSDHGEYFGEHLLVEHSKDLYMEATYVPLIVKQPGQTQGGVSDVVISSVDIPGMVLDALPPELAAPYRERFPYRPGNHPVLIENYYTRGKDLWHERWGHRFKRVRRAVIDWPYKYIRSSDGDNELFDLSVDPAESNNLHDSEVEAVRSLYRTLTDFRQGRRQADTQVEQAPMTPAEIEQLRALGYID